MAKKPRKTVSRALATKTQPLQQQQPLIPIAGTQIVPEARYRERSRRPFGPGPWQDEFEKTAWTDPASGYPCIILRQRSGELGGYVGVGPDHPLFGYSADALPAVIGENLHRPVTYANVCQSAADERVSICHVTPVIPAHMPSHGLHRGDRVDHQDKAWWFGCEFDGPTDIVPLRPRRGSDLAAERGATYKDEAFVYHQVVALARQLKAFGDAAKGRRPKSDFWKAGPASLPAPKREEGQ